MNDFARKEIKEKRNSENSSCMKMLNVMWWRCR